MKLKGVVGGEKPWCFYFVFILRCVFVPTVDGAVTDCGRLDDALQ